MTQHPAILPEIQPFLDTAIREVKISYGHAQGQPFSIRDEFGVAAFVRGVMTDNSREHIVALYLDGTHQVIAYSLLSIGTANMALIHPRELFQRAFVSGAVSLVLAHNHPSGCLQPSREDIELTAQIQNAGKLLGIPLLDHVIVSDLGHYSFRDKSQL